jgi:hypothetical protein
VTEANFATKHTKKGWRSPEAGRGRGDRGGLILLPILSQGIAGERRAVISEFEEEVNTGAPQMGRPTRIHSSLLSTARYLMSSKTVR